MKPLRISKKIKMNNTGLIWAGANPDDYSVEQIGGKGFNLLKLYNLSQKYGIINTPNFFIIPTNYHLSSKGNRAYFEDKHKVAKAFTKLKKPIIARSSSPLEDGTNASFAGMFSSFPEITTYLELCRRSDEIKYPENELHVKNYAQQMNIEYNSSIAVIIQEQVEALEKGTIQLEGEGARIELENQDFGKQSENMSYREVVQRARHKLHNTSQIISNSPEIITDEQRAYSVWCAKATQEQLGLEGVVQVEYLLNPNRKPDFVQIRQLPEIQSQPLDSDLTVPNGVPFIKSEVCNGVSGDITLPAYVTFSESAFNLLLIKTGHKHRDERMEKFYETSKLPLSPDFHNAQNCISLRDLLGKDPMPYFNKMWKDGNERFPEYILICDKLDETIAGMADLTTNKKAIITCMESMITSHAMTVARDLEIPAIGFDGDINSPDFFFNQIETGDLVHLKSNGKRAVAYIEKKIK